MSIESAFTQNEQEWLVKNKRILKSIIAENGKVSLDMKTQIEIWSRRQAALDARAKYHGE
jgi:hypothetical protein